MSKAEVIQIVERAVSDEVFRQLLFTNPDEALVGYTLTADERKRMGSLTEDTFDDFAGTLVDPSTKGFLPGE